MRRVPIVVLLNPVDRATGQDGNAVLLHLIADMGADVVVEATQDVVAAIDHSHEGTQAREDARKLQRDIATALDQDTLRQFG